MRRLAALVLVGGVATLAFGAGPALAQPCWKRLIGDWWDGRIDNAYSIACYRAAMRHAPEDLQAYSDLPSDLRRALAAALALRRHGNTYLVPAGIGGSQAGSESNRSGRDAAPVPVLTRSEALHNTLGAVHEHHDSSMPIPLIALGALGVLLLVAGATGVVLRRVRARDGP